MFCGRGLNNYMSLLHERGLRAVLQEYDKSFRDLLALNNDCSIHHTNLRKLLLEIYKVMKGLSPDLLKGIFQSKALNYSLRSSNVLQVKSHDHTASWGYNSAIFRGALLWNRLSDSLKSQPSFKEFRDSLRKCKEIKCFCNICDI